MGVLDEAIRDHLELKRRHGASEAELARAEMEALGPARRGAVGVSPVAAPPPRAEDREREPDDSGETTLLEPDDSAATRLLEPLEPPVTPEPRGPAEPELAEPRHRVVHDIDEDASAPPPPVRPPAQEQLSERPSEEDEPPSPEQREG